MRRRRSAAPTRPRVVLVGQARPAQGGIATYLDQLLRDADLREAVDLELVNTTRRAVRRAGGMTIENARNALVDAGRTFVAGRRSSIVHVHTALLPLPPLLRAVAVCAAGRLAGAQVICHVHSEVSEASGRPRPGSVTARVLVGLRLAQRVLTVSDGAATALAEVVPAGRIAVVDNAIDTASFARATPDHVPARIVYVGTVARSKGLLDLLAALEQLRAEGVDAWELEVIGSGNEQGEDEAALVASAYARAGLGASLVGPLDAPEVRVRLAAADLFVLPSHTEGQPLSILEAMASGLPVVATSVGAIPRVVRDGVDGVIVPPKDVAALAAALRRLLASPEDRLAMGASGRARAVERHDLAVLAATLVDIYLDGPPA